MGYYSRRHYQLVSPRTETKEEIAARVSFLSRYRKASEQALAELHERWPVLTAENFAAANKFREERTEELMK